MFRKIYFMYAEVNLVFACMHQNELTLFGRLRDNDTIIEETIKVTRHAKTFHQSSNHQNKC